VQAAALVTPFISTSDLPCLHAAAVRRAQQLQGNGGGGAATAGVLALQSATPYAPPQALEAQHTQHGAASFPFRVTSTLRVARAAVVWLEECHPAEADPLAAPLAVAAWRARADAACRVERGVASSDAAFSSAFQDAGSEAFWTPRRGPLSTRSSGTPQWPQDASDGATLATSFTSAASGHSAACSAGLLRSRERGLHATTPRDVARAARLLLSESRAATADSDHRAVRSSSEQGAVPALATGGMSCR
jgi:hypothetical protein